MSINVNLDPIWTFFGLAAAGFFGAIGKEFAEYLFDKMKEEGAKHRHPKTRGDGEEPP